MELYKCDRCHKLMAKEERFTGGVDGRYCDLCPTCFEEYKKDFNAATTLYQKQKHAIAVKYGMLTIKEALSDGQLAED